MSAPVAVDAPLLRDMPLPALGEDCDKDERGRVLVVGGSAAVPGAVVLAGEAALRAGAGKLQLAVPEGIAPGLGFVVPEARIIALPQTEDGEFAAKAAKPLAKFVDRADAVAIGPGLMDEAGAAAFTARVLGRPPGPGFVIDAAAMSGLLSQASHLSDHAGRVIITPHAGEMATLSDATKAEIDADPVAVARDVAARLKIVVVLKGRHTHIVTPAGAVWRHSEGVYGLATSGSGDVLAGVLAGLLARGASPLQAALWGVFLHGQAGERLSRSRGPLGFLARELPGEIPAILAEI
jgi:hydroxyethylthiazole kinase-like uncharacterized protein yjeF